MPVVAGSKFTATLIGPGGVTSGVGARVEVPVTRAIVSAFKLAVIDNTGTWTLIDQEAPLTPGSFNLVWMTTRGVEIDPFPIFVPLFVVAASSIIAIGGVDYPAVDTAQVTPTVDDVAMLEASRTRSADDGTEYDTFNDLTDPTEAQVEVIIGQAVQVVLAQLRTTFDPGHYPQVRQAAALLTAVLIEGSFFRNQAEQSGPTGTAGVWRSLYNQVISGLQQDIERDLQQALLTGVMEPRALA